jgi:hypothetical protein
VKPTNSEFWMVRIENTAARLKDTKVKKIKLLLQICLRLIRFVRKHVEMG